MSNFMVSLLWTLFGALIGAVITFFVTRNMFQKQIEENPPINEKQIRAMMMQMGRKPSEAQVRQVMKSMGLNKKSDKK